MVLWLTWVILPLLSLSLLLTRGQKDLMRIPAEKNVGKLRDRKRIFSYFLLRFMPPMLAYFFVFHWMLTTASDLRFPDTLAYFWLNDMRSFESDPKFSAEVFAAQNYALFVAVYFFVVLSVNFVHRTLSPRQFSPCKNLWWLAACIISLTLQALFAAVSLTAPDSSLIPLPHWSHVVFMLAFTLWILTVDYFVKRHDGKISLRNQRRLRLHFNTKLGMHSPQ